MERYRILAVRNWPTPTMIKEVQWFLGFPNYYRRFWSGSSSHYLTAEGGPGAFAVVG